MHVVLEAQLESDVKRSEKDTNTGWRKSEVVTGDIVPSLAVHMECNMDISFLQVFGGTEQNSGELSAGIALDYEVSCRGLSETNLKVPEQPDSVTITIHLWAT